MAWADTWLKFKVLKTRETEITMAYVRELPDGSLELPDERVFTVNIGQASP